MKQNVQYLYFDFQYRSSINNIHIFKENVNQCPETLVKQLKEVIFLSKRVKSNSLYFQYNFSTFEFFNQCLQTLYLIIVDPIFLVFYVF